MAEKDKKYFWLKLKRDFFKRHDIQIIEDMPNGKDYILFYLKLLCESVDHDGNLRFNDEIPYNEEMLATITRTNIDIVRSAVKVFSQLKMIEILDDGTLYMREVQKMLGGETYWAERTRLYRERKKCLTLSNESQTCQGKSIEINKEKDLNIKRKVFTPPTLAQIQKYCEERILRIDVNQFYAHYTANGWKQSNGNDIQNWRAAVESWALREKNFNAKDFCVRDIEELSETQKMLFVDIEDL